MSKLTVRPFIPTMKDETKEGREPFATLSFGDVTIEIDITIFRSLTLDLGSDLYTKTCQLFEYARKEMEREMWEEIDGERDPHHRDGTSRFASDPDRNPIHPKNLTTHMHIERTE